MFNLLETSSVNNCKVRTSKQNGERGNTKNHSADLKRRWYLLCQSCDRRLPVRVFVVPLVVFGQPCRWFTFHVFCLSVINKPLVFYVNHSSHFRHIHQAAAHQTSFGQVANAFSKNSTTGTSKKTQGCFDWCHKFIPEHEDLYQN